MLHYKVQFEWCFDPALQHWNWTFLLFLTTTQIQSLTVFLDQFLVPFFHQCIMVLAPFVLSVTCFWRISSFPFATSIQSFSLFGCTSTFLSIHHSPSLASSICSPSFHPIVALHATHEVIGFQKSRHLLAPMLWGSTLFRSRLCVCVFVCVERPYLL